MDGGQSYTQHRFLTIRNAAVNLFGLSTTLSLFFRRRRRRKRRVYKIEGK
jgi:hypothetical protein